MLNNLKRTYVELRLFRQAYRGHRSAAPADPTLLPERRDRGLLAYHLDDFPAALSDLEDYVRLNAWSEPEHADEEDKDEQAQIWEHIKNLRQTRRLDELKQLHIACDAFPAGGQSTIDNQGICNRKHIGNG